MKKPKILIADDDPKIHQALRVRLSALGYRVIESSDGLRRMASERLRFAPSSTIMIFGGLISTRPPS